MLFKFSASGNFIPYSCQSLASLGHLSRFLKAFTTLAPHLIHSASLNECADGNSLKLIFLALSELTDSHRSINPRQFLQLLASAAATRRIMTFEQQVKSWPTHHEGCA